MFVKKVVFVLVPVWVREIVWVWWGTRGGWGGTGGVGGIICFTRFIHNSLEESTSMCDCVCECVCVCVCV